MLICVLTFVFVTFFTSGQKYAGFLFKFEMLERSWKKLSGFHNLATFCQHLGGEKLSNTLFGFRWLNLQMSALLYFFLLV